MSKRAHVMDNHTPNSNWQEFSQKYLEARIDELEQKVRLWERSEDYKFGFKKGVDSFKTHIVSGAISKE